MLSRIRSLSMFALMCTVISGCPESGDDDIASPSTTPVPETPTPGERSPTPELEKSPTPEPTAFPTEAPAVTPTPSPATPTPETTQEPMATPTASPVPTPTAPPVPSPTVPPATPTSDTTQAPGATPTAAPTPAPTQAPGATPTAAPTPPPTQAPGATPTAAPTPAPTQAPLPTPTPPTDLDGDGSPATTDCDDADASSYPGATEICDGIDNDCDIGEPNGGVDEGVLTTFFVDTDGDGYGDEAVSTQACSRPDGYADTAGDCDDGDASISSAAEEVCDHVDNDCDEGQPGGGVDEDLETATYYADGDRDGYGDAESAVEDCVKPEGHVEQPSDCDDEDATAYPGAEEVPYDGIDQDCDGADLNDVDGDGYAGGEGGADCDDTNQGLHPDAEEACNGIDDNCDEAIDEGVTSTYYADNDADGFGDPSNSVQACAMPDGFVATPWDCNDDDAGVTFVGSSADCPASSCYDVLSGAPEIEDGTYFIQVESDSSPAPVLEVYCDMTTDGGGWTLFSVIRDVLASGGWEAYEMDVYGLMDFGTTALGRKPEATVLRIRVEGTDWHLDMKTPEPVQDFGIDQCEEVHIQATDLLDQTAVTGIPSYLMVYNNKSSGCAGIGFAQMGPDAETGAKIYIKGVTPSAEFGYTYLAVWGEHSSWEPPPASSLGGYQTHCDPAANDVHDRCSGFIDDPNWTGIYMYYR